MLLRYSMLPGAGQVWENTLRRPLELEVIDSEQFSPRHGFSSRAKIYAGVHPGETDNRHQVGMFPPRIRVPCRRRFHGSKMKGGGKKREKTTPRRARTGKKLRSQTVTKTFSASRPWFSSSCSPTREKRGLRKPRDAAVNNEFHLSFMRKGLWYISRLNPKVTRLGLVYNMNAKHFLKISWCELFSRW